MRRFATLSLVILLPAVAVVGCERAKSANPLSPSIAGPIQGVEIAAPKLLEPAAGSQIAFDQQPVTLVVENATTTGVRPLSYVFEIASDSAFSQVLFAQTGVAPGGGGTTSLKLPVTLGADRTYFWHARAEDGANTGTFAAPSNFKVYTPVVIEAPTPTSPADGATVTSLQPALQVTNAARSGPAGQVSYLFEVATDQAMANKVVSVQVGEQPGTTSYTIGSPLAASAHYYWHARALDPGHLGPWSPTMLFRTPAVATEPPGGGGGGGGGGPAPNDQLDLSTVTIVKGADITNWAVTSTLTSVTYSGGDLCTNHTKAGQWPTYPFFGDPSNPVEGNQWVFANIGGKWYGGAGEWLRPGQTCKGVPPEMGPDTFYDSPPLRDWIPKPGELVGFAVSTPARAGQWGTAERSNVLLIRW